MINKIINLDVFIEKIHELKIICSNNSVSNNIFNNIYNISETITNNIATYNEQNIIEILTHICPTKISDIYKLFNIYDVDIIEYCNYFDLIYKCISIELVKNETILNNKENYYRSEEWFSSSYINGPNYPYTYFNTKKTENSRVVLNDNKKNILTLKIKNEDLSNDLLNINLLIKTTNNQYSIIVNAIVINDSYNIIRNDKLFLKYYNKHYTTEQLTLYNMIHFRDCCLLSFNGQEPIEYIMKIYKYISECNEYCNNSYNNELTDNNIITNNIICVESAHYIQKFAKYCFHTKYIIIIYTAEHNISICLFLAIILVKCNNRLCRDFLDTLPNKIKQLIITNAGIGLSDDTKIETSLIDKINLTQRINIWKQLFSNKYGLNVKKLIEKGNELCIEDDKGSIFNDGNAEKERIKKMIFYLEKISVRFFLLKIHSELITIIDNAKLIYGHHNKPITSLHDVIILIKNNNITKVRHSDEAPHDFSDIGFNNIDGNNYVLTYAINNYLQRFTLFEQHVRKKILNLSEGHMTVKKAIWQYIMDIVCNPNPLATRKILCLIGPPGVGKTYIAITIARILFFEPDENPTDEEVKELVYILSIPSLTGEYSLLGSNSVYVGAHPGILTSEILFVNALFRKLIVIDEIDKPSKYTEQLLSILDYTQNSKIMDNFFEIELDMRSVVLIATANDESKINPILKDRMQIIHINGYSTQTKCQIIQKQLLKTLLKEKGLNENLIYIHDSVLSYIIQFKTQEAGIRTLKNLILEIINVVNLTIIINLNKITTLLNIYNDNTFITDDESFTGIINDKIIYNKYYKYDLYNITELYNNINCRYASFLNNSEHNSIILTKQDVDIILSNKYNIIIEHITDIVKWESGKIIGLYATSMGVGGILPITIKFNKSLFKKGMTITLNAQQTMQDSALICNILTSDYLFNLDNSIFNNFFGIEQSLFIQRVSDIVNQSAVHIMIDYSIQKDGPSAGGAFVIAHISKILGHVLSQKIGITGEINSNFKIAAIGGINMKINGAIQGGCRSVIIPLQNTNDMLRELINENSIDVKNVIYKRCAFIYYSDTDNCYMLLIRSNSHNNSISSFDINIIEGNSHYITTFDDTIPIVFKIKLTTLCNKTDLINPSIGLNIILFDTIPLSYIMKNYFTVFALENIFEIYYLMVMAKYIYDIDIPLVATIDSITDIQYDGSTILKS